VNHHDTGFQVEKSIRNIIWAHNYLFWDMSETSQKIEPQKQTDKHIENVFVCLFVWLVV